MFKSAVTMLLLVQIVNTATLVIQAFTCPGVLNRLVPMYSETTIMIIQTIQLLLSLLKTKSFSSILEKMRNPYIS